MILRELGLRSLRGFIVMTGYLNSALRFLLGFILTALVLIVTLQVVVRFVLPPLGIVISAPWSEEAARYLMIWSVFLGAAVATRTRDLVAIDSLPNALGPFGARIVRGTSYVITLSFFAFLVWIGLRWTDFGQYEHSTVMDLPMFWIYASMPLGAAVAFINVVARLLENALRPAEPELSSEIEANII